MDLRRSTNEYDRGVKYFLDKTFERGSQGNEILCPCKRCFNQYWHTRTVVENHLFGYGFVNGYTKWVFHGERFSSTNMPHPNNDDETSDIHDDIDGLLYDTLRNVEGDMRHEGVREGPSEDAKIFFKFVEEGKQELYPGCKNFSKLSFTIRLYLFKCIHGLSNVAFSDLLDLIKKAFPFAQLPESFNKAIKVIKDLGLGYEKIHACLKDCMLFWNDNAKIDNCSVCGSSRWKNVRDDLTNTNTKIPAKVLRYPADGEAWKDFDSLHRDFSKDPRNVRLGLSSDGFNPFRTMSISHSTWPIMLMNYNLPPWVCMKPEYIMLSMIIPGPSSPVNDIDVFLQPLIAELKDLWEMGVETYNAETNQTFLMRAALLWTVSDFPALAIRKMCYLGHRAFLPPDHPFRGDKKSFDGKEEHKAALTPLSGIEVLEELCEFNNVFGKGRQKRARKSDGPWKKRSIFFKLPYWAHNKLRHNLDVMHIEKNICDSLLGTLLDVPRKSKDHVNSRYDLHEMGIRKELQPLKDDKNGKIHLAKACFFMKPEEKRLFCTVLKNVKLPKGCASNISHRVQMEEMKVSGYKSHDAHFIMRYLLQVAVRKVLPKNVSLALIRLGNYFRTICSKVIRRRDLDKMKAEIIDIVCDLEKIFPPTFFDIMTHLPIHLVDKIKLGGPVHLRWMHPNERNMCGQIEQGDERSEDT
ncbi:uncharacterized protein LOC132611897 [Lycium barbarum]|uniref:uncharacterized protein LOC132611897 n=1 Tax=Lycium barbarum TaxID=112863 RepID=UPI00293ECA26|nr:uncharacterized protein LOC132611897 [Lycium barbarum]